MSQLVTAATVFAFILTGFGFHVLSRRLRTSPLDVEAPLQLIEFKRARTELPPPTSLAKIQQIVADGLTSRAASERLLVPLLRELAYERAQAGHPTTRLTDPHLNLPAWLDQNLKALEETE
ncbi:MAG: hypothetical protein ACI91O_001663 [Candidatus Poriferisodalaceae bacterium]|jgi:hypothetical protein